MAGGASVEAVRATEQQLYRVGQQLKSWEQACSNGDLAVTTAFEQGAVIAMMLAYRLWLRELSHTVASVSEHDSALQLRTLVGSDMCIPEIVELAELEGDAYSWVAQLFRSYRKVWYAAEPQLLIAGGQEYQLTPDTMRSMLASFKQLAERFRQAQTPY